MNKKCVLNFAHLMDRDVNALLNPLFEWRRVTLECSQLKMSWVHSNTIGYLSMHNARVINCISSTHLYF